MEIDHQEIQNSVTQMIKAKQQDTAQFEQDAARAQEKEGPRLDTADTSVSRIEKAPSSFVGTLKEYQMKGLRWLDSLYIQGINGILADEMGLGKTIQAISLLSHLSENKNVWGPFLIVTPATTLHNWKREIEKFCPSLKVLPYWGSLAERKAFRKFFNPKYLGL